MSDSALTDTESSSRRSISVGEASAATRRALDPAAWVVLEELVIIGDSAGGRVEALVLVRQLADSLGLSKDTVAAALRRLSTADLVRRADGRDGASGRFGRSRYVVDVATAGLDNIQGAPAPPPVVSDTVTPRSRRRRFPASHTQLSLLDLNSDASGHDPTEQINQTNATEGTTPR